MPNDHRYNSPSNGHRTRQSQANTAQPASQFNEIKFSKPIDPELFNTRAKGAAQAVSCSDSNRNKSTQLRRFYDELVAWESRVTQQPVTQQLTKFDECLPFIRMLNAKAAYAEGRKLVDRIYVNLLQHTLSEVSSPETLTTCKLFWEAFMGFYKQERQD